MCGNNIKEGGEQCDDGNTQGGDGCSATCQNENPSGTSCANPNNGLEVTSFTATPSSGNAYTSFAPLLKATLSGPVLSNDLDAWVDCTNDGVWDFTGLHEDGGGWSPPPTLQTNSCIYNNPGTYFAQIRATTNGAAAGPACAVTQVTVSIPPKPIIDLSPRYFGFTGTSGKAAADPPNPQTLTIKNTGSADLHYTLTTDQAWCRINGVNNTSNLTGTLAPSALNTINVSVDALSAVGTFSCTITASDPNAPNSPQHSYVTYTVVAGDPSNVAATNPNCSNINLSWTAGSGASIYNIYRNTVNSASAAPYASNIVGTSYIDIDPTPIGTHFYYWIETVGGTGNKIPANTNASGGIAATACPVNQPPTASASISKDGVTYSGSITVTQGVATPVYLSAAGSSDPDGWTDANFGVSSGGKCDWNSDLNQGAPTYETTVNNPASPAACNISLGPLTFNDPPGTYTYSVLRITDKPGATSNVATVQVTVNAPAACPSGSVTLNPTSVGIGGTSTASAPAGWSGGSFASSNTSVATVSGSTVTGVAAGSSSITGSGWTAPNGATACVLTGATLTVNTPPPTNNATCQSMGLPATAQVNQSIPISVTMQNIGGTNWVDSTASPNYHYAQSTWNPPDAMGSVYLLLPSSPVTPGQSVTFSGNVNAPSTAGSYSVTWQMFQQNVGSFGTTCIQNITVTAEANLSLSDKNIIRLNATTFNPAPGQCDGVFQQATPPVTSFKLGDVVTFEINLCNSGSANATNVVVTDQLTNLSQPATGWQATLDGSAITPTVSGSAPNQTLTFNVGTVINSSSRKIIFQAQIAVPTGFSGTSSRFQNTAAINFNKSAGVPALKTVYTPLLLFTITQVPTKQEVGP